jgi:hypothetical protein
MTRHWRYLKYVCRHKWFVLLAGLRLGVGLRQLLIHDWSKFLPGEWGPYAAYFYGVPVKRGGIVDRHRRDRFNAAWLHHQHFNPHHYQYWVLRNDDGSTVCLPMPDKYRREMVVDWRGAGLALGKPDTAGWYLHNRERILLHDDTRAWVERTLGVGGGDAPPA